MTLYEKHQWLEKYGKVTFYCRIADSAPFAEWSARITTGSRMDNIRVEGDGFDSVHELYDTAKNRLFSLCLGIER